MTALMSRHVGLESLQSVTRHCTHTSGQSRMTALTSRHVGLESLRSVTHHCTHTSGQSRMTALTSRHFGLESLGSVTHHCTHTSVRVRRHFLKIMWGPRQVATPTWSVCLSVCRVATGNLNTTSRRRGDVSNVRSHWQSSCKSHVSQTELLTEMSDTDTHSC